MIEVTSTLKKVGKELSFDAIVTAMNHSNVGSYIQKDVDQFLAENGLSEVPHIFMATHSMGGREWEIVEGHDPRYYPEECFNGGWYIFREEEVSWLWCSSASSGSSLLAERQKDGTWTLTLEVPFENGKPYTGYYWECFHNAVSPQTDKEGTAPE